MIRLALLEATSRAKPLLYVVLLIAAWIVARILFVLATTQASDGGLETLTPRLANVQKTEILNVNPRQMIKAQQADKVALAQLDPDIDYYGLAYIDLPVQNLQKPSAHSRDTSGAAITRTASFYPILFLNAMEERSSALVPPSLYAKSGWNLPAGNGVDLAARQEANDDAALNPSLASRLSAYAYIFARSGDGDADALGGRYGGSQAAIQASYRLNPNQKTVIDATLRAQTALRGGDSEISAGVRLKPNRDFPVAAIAERRFRPSNPDGYAFYLAGGKSDISLPAKFKLNVYGQTGLSTAGRDTLFFDGQAVAEKPIHNIGTVEISAGAGAWTGGQRGAQRLDIGPSVSVKFSSSQKSYRISGGWRERIAGDAAPGSGAALTLSTDF